MQAGAQIGAGRTADRLASNQATQLQQQAAAVRSASVTREEMQRSAGRAAIAEGVASDAAAGGGPLSGSALDMLRQSMFNSEMDALQIRYEGQVRSTSLENDAAAVRAEGRQKRSSSFLTAAGTLAGGVSSYLSHGGRIPAFDTGLVRSDGSMMEAGRMSPDWLRRSEKRAY